MTSTPIRIFIGSEPKTKVPSQVLIHSIKSRTQSPVQITIMEGPEWEVPSNLHQGTGFSLRRLMIPEHCKFEGRAIYLDADQIVLADIAELWGFPDREPGPSPAWCTYQPDKHFRRGGPQTSVMVLECAKATDWKTSSIWRMLSGNAVSYTCCMHLTWIQHKPQVLPLEWNHFNDYRDGWTKLTHLTQEKHQSWYNPDKNRVTWLWEKELEAAIRAGAVNEDDFRYGLKRYGKPDPGDRRRTFGIHPYFEKYLPVFAESK